MLATGGARHRHVWTDTQLSVAVVAVAIVVHAVFLWMLFTFTEVRLGTYEYQEIARNVALGRGFVLEPGGPPILWRPPLYIFLLAGLYRTFGDGHLPVVAVQVLLSALISVVLFRLGIRLFDRPTAFAGALVTSLHPFLLYSSARVMTETLFTCLLASLTLTFAGLFERPPKGAVWLGLLSGLASLTRAAFQFFPIALFITSAFVPTERRRGFVRGVIVATAVMILLVAPWTLRNYLVSGGELIVIDTSGGYTLWVGNSAVTDGQDDDGLSADQRVVLKRTLAGLLHVDPAAAEVANGKILEMAWSSHNNRVLFRQALREMVDRPLGTAILWVKKFFRFWFLAYQDENRHLQPLVTALQLAVLLPGSVGLALRLRETRRLVPVVVVILYLVALHTVVAANVRYSVPLLPYFVLAGVYAVRRILPGRVGGDGPAH